MRIRRAALPVLIGILASAAPALAGSTSVATSSEGTTIVNGKPCRVVTRQAGDRSGSHSTTITAGGGAVSGSTTVSPGGSGASSSVTVGSGSSGGGTSSAASSDCVIHRDERKKK